MRYEHVWLLDAFKDTEFQISNFDVGGEDTRIGFTVEIPDDKNDLHTKDTESISHTSLHIISFHANASNTPFALAAFKYTLEYDFN